MYSFEPNKIKIGISSCLLGQEVRFDGGHKQSKYCRYDLSQYFDFQPICPEMAIGMGAPRKTIRLVNQLGDIRVKASDDSFDVTDKLREFSSKKSAQLVGITGYIFCAKSPTCGMERVNLYKDGTKDAVREGVGVFAAQVMADHPLIPVEEEGRLNDPVLRENFITRVFAYHDWQTLRAQGATRDALYKFHARYKYLLMAHDVNLYYKLGPLLAQAKGDVETIADQYIELFMQVLKGHPTRKSHANTLSHIQGYLKRSLRSEERQQLAKTIDKYRQGLIPLLAAMTLIKHYLTLYPDAYIEQQIYLNPHPEELKLRYEH
ncbi:YbgA family protein [Motilimonas eburnea]|uniref:YbgA family protein n=1 Tax=Motilimonas eburnea TaxID=1737488 RepID=UPI001E434323|nr:DUF523 and DUF1722 domain-containing protein [Motilimonas eburnea]MCE2573139.1 DUF523 and DUF1722 domain-containing protein [Motilimonas eburnea]